MVACTVDFGHGSHGQLSRRGSAQYDTGLLLKFTAQPQLTVVAVQSCTKGIKSSSQLQQLPGQQPALNLDPAIKHAMETMPICFSIFEWDG